VSTISVFNPATGELSGSVEQTTSEELKQAASRARAAQKQWQRTPFSTRARILARFHDLAIEQAETVFDTIQSETGKSRRDALAELFTVAGTARYYLTRGGTFLTPKRKRGAVPILTRSLLEYRPHGLVGLITPWNYPFVLSVGDSIPALLAGNAVLIKPSEWTPLSTVLGKNLLVAGGLDPDLFVVVHGGPETGRALIDHVDYVAFTGGTATGQKVAMAAAERLIPYSLELGGKNPMIVSKEAPLRQAAAALVTGAFANAGQTCISVERVYVESPVFDRFVQLVAEATRNVRLGWSRSFDIDVGSMIRESHAQKVQGRIDAAVRQGASVLVGGRTRADLGPTFVEPTVLVHVDPRQEIAVEETFGPVISLHRTDNTAEAIALANDSAYGLHASLWTGGSASALSIARELETGSVAINSSLMIYNAFDLPMGGIKKSGIGRRHGEHGLLRYTQAQSIVRSFEAGGGYDRLLTKVRSEKAASMMLKLLKIWRRIPGLR